MTNEIKVLDKKFKVSIPEEEILESVKRVAKEMSNDIAGKDPLFLCVLNGAFMFASDLMKEIDFQCEISFVKLASYVGTETSGKVKQLIGINEGVEGRTVVIIEDIVDTGYTMTDIVKQLKNLNPKEIKIATLLHKPEALKVDLKVDYVGFAIPNDFILGYGLDYNGRARNLRHIYTVVD